MLTKPLKLTTLERQYTPLDGHEWRDIILYQAQEELLSYDSAINQQAREMILGRLEWLINEGSEFSGARLYDRANHKGSLRVSLDEGSTTFTCQLDCQSDLSGGEDEGVVDPYSFQFITFPSKLMIDGRTNKNESDLLGDYLMKLELISQHPDEAREQYKMGLPTPVVTEGGQIVDQLIMKAEPQSSDPFVRNIEAATGMVANSIPADMD